MPGHDEAEPTPTARGNGEIWRSFAALGLPSWLLLAFLVLPLASGDRTFFYRDVLNTHYPLKAAQAQLDDDGPAPLIDPFRGGGQPLLGNPNAVPFYPTNWLFDIADPLWALNAHLWLHWLLAPFAGYWLGRAWRLGRAGSWACGLAWSTSGTVLSLLNLYNMVSLAVLAPATVAAFVGLARSRTPARTPARAATAAVLVALTFLGGDPASAALAYGLAAAAFLVARRDADPSAVALRDAVRLRGDAARPAFVAVLGAMLAAPVWVEMLRVLPASYRGLWRYDAATVLAQSWHPATLLEWLLPGFFGALDLSFWGTAVFGGNPPFLTSLVPGWIVLALALAAGFQRRGPLLWAWGAVGVGLFLALGGHNPILVWVAQQADFGLLRYPVKAWLAAALGLSLLAGRGFERLARPAGGVLRSGGARLVGARLVAAAVLLAAIAASAWTRTQLHADSLLVRHATEVSNGRLGPANLDVELARWQLSSATVLLCLVSAFVLLLVSRRVRWAPALLLLLHSASQIALLAPLLATDDAAPYRDPSPLASLLEEADLTTADPETEPPADAEGLDVVHGAFDAQFGPWQASPDPKRAPSLAALGRSRFDELFHGAGVAEGLRYPFVRSPEGLDSFYAVAFAKALPLLDDAGRLRLLRAAGVEFLLLDRPLAADARNRVAEIRLPLRSLSGRPLHLVHLRGGAPEVSWVAGVRRAGSMTEARDALLDPTFDPRREVVLPAAGDGRADVGGLEESDPGRRVQVPVEVPVREVERLVVRTRSVTAGHLVVQRAWLPIWRATVDGEPAEIEIANGWQMAVAVPAGRHEVRLFVDRGPSRWARGAFFLALGIVGWLVLVPSRVAAKDPTQSRGV